MLLDSGSCYYALPEYIDYYCQSRAHNVILYNGKGQEVDDLYYGVTHPGRLDGDFRADWIRTLRADGRRLHVNSNQQIDGYETDAYLLCIGSGNGLAIDASYVRYQGKSLMDSYTKKTSVFHIDSSSDL